MLKIIKTVTTTLLHSEKFNFHQLKSKSRLKTFYEIFNKSFSCSKSNITTCNVSRRLKMNNFLNIVSLTGKIKKK
ncbi:MAG: hypothetical protein U0T61_00350 [Buchnera aphidicola (Melaphis rhois)]